MTRASPGRGSAARSAARDIDIVRGHPWCGLRQGGPAEVAHHARPATGSGRPQWTGGGGSGPGRSCLGFVVYTPLEVEEWRGAAAAFVTTALREGKVLYEKQSRRGSGVASEG